MTRLGRPRLRGHKSFVGNFPIKASFAQILLIVAPSGVTKPGFGLNIKPTQQEPKKKRLKKKVLITSGDYKVPKGRCLHLSLQEGAA